VSVGGASTAGHGGETAGASGSPASSGGTSSDAGAPGEAGASPMPVALFPSELEADVACNMQAFDATLLIRNAGDEPLVIRSAKADSGYTVKTALPLEIAPLQSGSLLVTPPAPSATADAGTLSKGTLTFTTNEPGSPTHEVTLLSTVFEGSFELTDSSGTPVTQLELQYGSGGDCPDLTKYRIVNTGNATFTLTGPTFDSHFAGTTLGESGQAIPPGGYAELLVGGTSAPGSACSANGDLTFSVMGPLCGSAPKLHVNWAKSTDPDAGASCACTVPTL